MSEDKSPRVITPPNTLKTKVKVGGPGAVDPEVLERAEAVIANLTDNYLEWVQEDFEKILQAYNDLKATQGDNCDVLERVFQVAHDMKGQGGSFGYDLITVIGNQLCRFLEKVDRSKVGPSEVEIIRVHIDAMRVVISNRIRGDGGKIGRELLAGLDLVSQKSLGK